MKIYNAIEEVRSQGQIEANALLNGDCLKVMKYIPSGSIDMVLCDLPYG